MKKVASERRRFGYRRIHVMLDRQGIVMNLKKLRRLYREEKLTVRKRGGRKRALGTRRPLARRMRAAIGQVFRFAIATARAENDPTFGLRGALTAPVVTHRAAFTDRRAFGGLLRAVWSYEGAIETRIALQLMAYLYPRPGELRHAEWKEFDVENAVWTIPATKTKMRREHRKYLTKNVLERLAELRQLTGNERLLFPAITSRLRPMSENTMNSALRRMGFTAEEVTSHGFRATASTILNESGLWSPDVIEAELAHVGADAVRRAYHRALYWEDRIKMAEWWAALIAEMRSAPAELPGSL